ncbi:MAG: efflux RND transporter permease subunit [Deltaproteobacteria bacterium]|nr:efflux RND transporter permease subunit [Deltaproteobacteria bacterium]
MTLPEFGVKRPVATTVVFSAMVILGLFSLAFIQLDLMPAMDIPVIGIITVYKGAGPQEIESRITRPLEQYVSTVQRLSKLESTSQEGVSFVMMSFDWGANLDEISVDVREKIDFARKYMPSDAERPMIFRFDPSMMPIVIFGINAEESYPRLKKIVKDEIARPLERVGGVGTVIVRGGAERQIRVLLDRDRLAAYKIGLDQIQLAVLTSNMSVPGGHLETGRTDFLVRVPAEYRGIEEVGDTVIGGFEGQVVRLRDVAEVRDSPEEQTSFVEINRNRGVMLIVQKQSTANTVEVVDAIHEELVRLKKNIPEDVKIAVIRDFSNNIKASLSTLKNDLMLGGILVILILIGFLRNLRASLIVSVSLPTSLIVTFLLMYWSGYTLNMLSLAALAIAVGLVVDDAIVVIDNIHRHLTRGKRADIAAVEGTAEVSLAVVVATLTNVAIFVPIIFIGGIVGVIFKQMAWILILALMASLLTALLFVPMLTARFMPRGFDTRHTRTGTAVFGALGAVLERVENAYGAILSWALRFRKTVVAGAFAFFAGSMALSGYVGTEFMPKQDISQVTIDVKLPEGARTDDTGAIIRDSIDVMYKNVPEKSAIMASWGYGGESIEMIFGTGMGSNLGQIILRLVDAEHRNVSSEEVAQRLRPLLASYPGATVNLTAEDPYAGFLFGGKPISVEVRGYELAKARKLAEDTAEMLRTVKGLHDIEISRKEGVPELQIVLDRKKASAMGMNIYQVAMAVNTALAGTSVTKFREEGDEFDVFFKLRPEDRREVADIEKLTISSVTGEKIAIGNFAAVERGFGPLKIERKDRDRVIKVGADLIGRDLGSASVEIQEKFKDVMVPEGFSLKLGGAREEQMKAFKWLWMALLLSILLVYMVMAGQFESFRGPFIMLMALPFGTVGAMLALLILGKTLSMMAFVGLILVGGLAVKNGVVLIDYINRLREGGASVRDAVIEGGRNRLRPVLMTALSMFFGMLPMATFKGEGSEQWQPFGTTVMGGLVVATVVTLVLCPVLYAMFEGRKERT